MLKDRSIILPPRSAGLRWDRCRAACRAGYIAANTATAPSNPSDSMADCQVGCNPAKYCGMGIRLNSAQKPKEMAMPRPPLTNTTIMVSTKNCIMMLRDLAPTALRTPISRVRSRTATSITFITPSPPRNNVVKPTAPRKYFIPLVMVRRPAFLRRCPIICRLRIVRSKLCTCANAARFRLCRCAVPPIAASPAADQAPAAPGRLVGEVLGSR